MSEPHTLVPGLLAVELIPDSALPSLALPVESAGLLGEAIADDLLRLLPGCDRLGLAVAAALYDAAQILRPGWPIFTRLGELHGRAQRGAWQPAVCSFGAAAALMPDPLLEPDRRLIGSPLLLIPWTLIGPAAAADAIAARMEQVLVETGLAAARTALLLNEACSIKVDHARYLSRHDLCAISATQYQNLGQDALWSLIECALLSPEREETVTAASGRRYRWRDGAVEYADPTEGDGAAADPEASLFAAVLAAHGVQMTDDGRQKTENAVAPAEAGAQCRGLRQP
ncbi:MAG: hypothetical protein AB7V26_04920 [Lysobacterales bacterium]